MSLVHRSHPDEPVCVAVIGPMFAGKTTYLQALVKHLRHCNIGVLFVQHELNTRGPEGVSLTHSMQECGCISVTGADDLVERATTALESGTKIIVIDEAQFFPDLPEIVERLQDIGCDLYFGALSSQWDRRPFESVRDSLHFCTKIRTLSAICPCGNTRARFTMRTVASQEQVLVGGADSYRPACASCFTTEFAEEEK